MLGAIFISACNTKTKVEGKPPVIVVEVHEYPEKNNPDNKDSGILTYNGVHMNNEGNQFLADIIVECPERTKMSS